MLKEKQEQEKADTDELSALLSDCSIEELERVTQMVKLFLRKSPHFYYRYVNFSVENLAIMCGPC